MFKDCSYGQMSSHTEFQLAGSPASHYVRRDRQGKPAIEFQLHIILSTLDINPNTPNINTCTTHHKINIKNFAY